MASERARFRVGGRVRVIELDVDGRVVDVLGDQELVIVDLHGQPDRLAVDRGGLEHVDLK